jgi:16S rRNA G966 N2-methylase RsmD
MIKLKSFTYSLIWALLRLLYTRSQCDNIILFGGLRYKDKVKIFVSTPQKLVDEAVGKVVKGGLDGKFVLEPSAGRGAFVRALSTSGSTVFAIEPNMECDDDILKGIYDCRSESLVFWRKGRFEDYYKLCKTKFDYVFMHPPYEYQLDVDHTIMAFDLLKKGGTLYCITNQFSLYRPTAKTIKFLIFLLRNRAKISKINLSLCSYKVSSIEIIIKK